MNGIMHGQVSPSGPPSLLCHQPFGLFVRIFVIRSFSIFANVPPTMFAFQGTYTWPDGRMYEGYWVNGMFCGQGTLREADGSKYTGDFAHNKPHGQGEPCPRLAATACSRHVRCGRVLAWVTLLTLATTVRSFVHRNDTSELHKTCTVSVSLLDIWWWVTVCKSSPCFALVFSTPGLTAISCRDQTLAHRSIRGVHVPRAVGVRPDPGKNCHTSPSRPL